MITLDSLKEWSAIIELFADLVSSTVMKCFKKTKSGKLEDSEKTAAVICLFTCALGDSNGFHPHT